MKPFMWNNESCEEDLLDSVIKLALSQHAEAEGRAIWAENEKTKCLQKFLCSSKLKKEITKINNFTKIRENFRDFLFATYKLLTPVAMIFFILSSSFLTIFAASDEFREAIYRLVFNEKIRYIELNPDVEHDAFIDSYLYPWKHCFAPTYIPNSFEYHSSTGTELSSSVRYESANGNFVIFRQSQNAISRVDNERVLKQEYIMIGDSEGLLTITGDRTIILKWQIGESLLTIISNIEENEVIKIAQNIKILR